MNKVELEEIAREAAGEIWKQFYGEASDPDPKWLNLTGVPIIKKALSRVTKNAEKEKAERDLGLKEAATAITREGQNAPAVDSRELAEWLKPQCSRLLHGFCSTRRCLLRGGALRQDGKLIEAVDYSKATCEPYELSRVVTQGEVGNSGALNAATVTQIEPDVSAGNVSTQGGVR